MSDKPRLEEQALSEAAEMTIAAQLDEVENIDVAVRTNLLKIVQGQADSVSLTAQGMVVQKDIRVQEMELHVESIGVDILSAIFGQIELDKPLDAFARLVLTQQDINRALNGDFIRSKFQSLELNLGCVPQPFPDSLRKLPDLSGSFFLVLAVIVLPLVEDLVEVDVRQERRDDPALRCAGLGVPNPPLLQHAGLEPLIEHPAQDAVPHPLVEHRAQVSVVHGVKEALDVGFDDPAPVHRRE